MYKASQRIACALALSIALVRGETDYDYYDASSADSLDFFTTLADMPPEQQDALLSLVGAQMERSSPVIDCNIFGGKDACKSIPNDSAFAAECAPYRDNLQVDCVFYTSSEAQLEMHPGDALQHYLLSTYDTMNANCPECMINLQALWCVQALPDCGSFQDSVHKAIFPAIVKVKEEQDAGYPESVAIIDAVPDIISAISKTLACREMCHAAVSTCSCGSGTLTFGEAIKNAQANDQSFSELGLQTLGDDFKDSYFKDIWDKPVCDIFTPSDDPSFAGECTPAVLAQPACSNSDFCSGLSEEQKQSTESIIAAQLARSIFAFVDGPAGLISQTYAAQSNAPTIEAAGGTVAKRPGSGVPAAPANEGTGDSSGSSASSAQSTGEAVEGWDGQDVREVEVEEESPKSSGGTSVVGVFFGLLVTLVVGGAIGMFAWRKYKEHQNRQMGFGTEFGEYGPIGDDGIPLQ